MMLEKVIRLEKESGYDTAEYKCEWRGYSCYEPLFDGKEMMVVGLPYIIMVDRDGNIRMSTEDEIFAFMDEQMDEDD